MSPSVSKNKSSMRLLIEVLRFGKLNLVINFKQFYFSLNFSFVKYKLQDFRSAIGSKDVETMISLIQNEATEKSNVTNCLLVDDLRYRFSTLTGDLENDNVAVAREENCLNNAVTLFSELERLGQSKVAN